MNANTMPESHPSEKSPIPSTSRQRMCPQCQDWVFLFAFIRVHLRLIFWRQIMNYEELAAEVVARAKRAGADEADVLLQTSTEFDVQVHRGEIETLTQA